MYIVHIVDGHNYAYVYVHLVQSAYMQHYRAGKLREDVSEMSLYKLTVNLAIQIPSNF